MAKISMENIKKTINGWCVAMLDFIGYEIPEESRNQHLRFHVGLIITSLAMFAVSFVSLFNGVGWLVFIFHSVSIFYKLIVLQMQKRIARAEAEKEKQGRVATSGRIISPYHSQFYLLIALLVLLLIVMVATFIYKGDSAWFFTIVALFSLVVSLSKEVLDGLVLLYDARGTGHYPQKKRNW